MLKYKCRCQTIYLARGISEGKGLWAFNKGKTFEEGCLLAVNLGDDADTTGAVYGQIAGAYFGEQGIPQKWLTNLAMRPIILDLAHRLFDSSKKWRHRPDWNWRPQP